MIFSFLIQVYQKTLSPDHGALRHFFPYGYCKFYPSCSEYARSAFKALGTRKGLYYSISRLMRCHPWSKGGIDFPL